MTAAGPSNRPEDAEGPAAPSLKEQGWRLERGDGLGSWRITGALGKGGMGEVYEGRHSYLPRQAAIKVMRVLREDKAGFAERFQAEAAALSCVDHANVVRLYDANVTDDGLAWMAMELLNGRGLDKVLEEQQTLSVEDTLQILAEVADGVHAAHLVGIVHRDLKPSNVFITDRDLVKVLDFGTVKLFDRSKPLSRYKHSTQQNVIIGTVAFMSPEQVLRKPPLDHRSDIFSLGVMGYMMLCGRHPFVGEDPIAEPQALMYRALIMEPDPITHFLPSCPIEIWMALSAMLAKDRERRPPTMADLAKQLRALREKYLAREQRPIAPLQSIEPAGRLVSRRDKTIDPRAARDALGRMKEEEAARAAAAAKEHDTTPLPPQDVTTPLPAPAQPVSLPFGPRTLDKRAQRRMELAREQGRAPATPPAVAAAPAQTPSHQNVPEPARAYATAPGRATGRRYLFLAGGFVAIAGAVVVVAVLAPWRLRGGAAPRADRPPVSIPAPSQSNPAIAAAPDAAVRSSPSAEPAEPPPAQTQSAAPSTHPSAAGPAMSSRSPLPVSTNAPPSAKPASSGGARATKVSPRPSARPADQDAYKKAYEDL